MRIEVTVGYFTLSKWAIRHEGFTFYDPDRDNRPVAVDIAIRWDKQMKADAGMIKLPVVVFSHGNTVKSIEYSFINNVFAAHGYMVLSIQHDLATDTPMVTKPRELSFLDASPAWTDRRVAEGVRAFS